MAARRVRIIVRGEVQGVNFRRYAKLQADELGLQGYVRNLPDMGVEVVAEGDARKIEELVAFCRRGPPSAVVTEAIVDEERPTGEFGDFRIRY
jgi:acylphosphatase